MSSPQEAVRRIMSAPTITKSRNGLIMSRHL
jgi:hypothetical protein